MRGVVQRPTIGTSPRTSTLEAVAAEVLPVVLAVFAAEDEAAAFGVAFAADAVREALEADDFAAVALASEAFAATVGFFDADEVDDFDAVAVRETVAVLAARAVADFAARGAVLVVCFTAGVAGRVVADFRFFAGVPAVPRRTAAGLGWVDQ